MSRNNAQASQLDPYVKPKPGQKRSAASDSSQSNYRPTNAQVQNPQQGFVVPPPHQQKLMLCKYYELGQCQRGNKCWFAHGKEELRHPQKHASRQEAHAPKPAAHEEQDQEQCPDQALFKTRMCVYFQQGRCQRGTTCTFAHDPAELQAYNPARRYTQQAPASPAHTLDKFLPQRLQDEAAAATALKQAGAKNNESRDDAPRVSYPSVPLSTTASTSSDAATSLSEAHVPSVPPAVERAVPNASSQPYVTPMPNGASLSNGTANQRAQGKVNGHGNLTQSGDAGGRKALVGQLAQKSNAVGMSSTDEDYVDDLEAPSSFCCPITTELLRDPVVAADGHTYERQHIAEWLQKSDTSPMTNAPMEHKLLTPNLALRAVMDAYFGVREGLVQQMAAM